MLRSMAQGISLATIMLSACPAPTEAGREPTKTGAPAPRDTAEPATGEARPPDDARLGRIVDDAPIRWAQMLGHTPDAIEALLGPASATESTRISCVRFLPDRVFFSCTQELRRYPGPAGLAEGIAVDYEDGRAAAVAVTGPVGTGEFDPAAALRRLGLDLPGTPRHVQPQAGVDVWDWWNTEARLLVEGRQYRVQVSVVDGAWARAKVEVLLNHPLTNDEKARIKLPARAAGAEETASPG